MRSVMSYITLSTLFVLFGLLIVMNIVAFLGWTIPSYLNEKMRRDNES